MVDERSECVHKKNGKHHSLGVTRVEEPDSDAEGSDKESVDLFAALSLG